MDATPQWQWDILWRAMNQANLVLLAECQCWSLEREEGCERDKKLCLCTASVSLSMSLTVVDLSPRRSELWRPTEIGAEEEITSTVHYFTWTTKDGQISCSYVRKLNIDVNSDKWSKRCKSSRKRVLCAQQLVTYKFDSFPCLFASPPPFLSSLR